MHLWGSTYWPIGLIVVAVAFLVPETFALFTNVHNTLSDYCWRELGIGTARGRGVHTAAWWFSLAAWGLFVLVITGHIWFKVPD